MSIECGECEHNLRGYHATWCSRYKPEYCAWCRALDSLDEEGECFECGEYGYSDN